MTSPFPGMDPYLEAGHIWPDVHHRLITNIGDALSAQVAPAYFVAVEVRTYILEVESQSLVRKPDVALIPAHSSTEAGRAALTSNPIESAQEVTLPVYEQVREGYLKIKDVGTQEVVTVIELLSPTNKSSGSGREEYEAKRREVLYTRTNLVEIDLLRMGRPMEMQPVPKSDYRILVRLGWEENKARVHPFGVRDSLPTIWVPLRRNEPSPELSLGTLFSAVYDRARYDIILNYSRPPDPPLREEDAAWAAEILSSHS